MTKDDEEVDRYTQVIVDAILEAAPSGDIANVGTREVIVMQHVLSALVSVQSYVLAATDSQSGTPGALKKFVGDYAKALSRWTKERRSRPDENPFAVIPDILHGPASPA